MSDESPDWLRQFVRTHTREVDVGLLLLVAAALAVGVYDEIGPFAGIPTDRTIGLMLLLVSGLGLAVVISVASLRDVSDRLNAAVASQERSERTLQLFAEAGGQYDRIAVVLDPRDPEQYREAWGGFERDYSAFNPTFSTEESNFETDRLVAETFGPRFAVTTMKEVRYLFFSTAPETDRNLSYFRELMIRTDAATNGRVRQILDVRFVVEEPPPHEFYYGTKGRRRVAVIDFCLPQTQHAPGVPDFVYQVFRDDITGKLDMEFNARFGQPGSHRLAIGPFLDRSVPLPQLVAAAESASSRPSGVRGGPAAAPAPAPIAR